MELKSTLNKPYTNIQRADFIVENNHQHGYEIRETETELQAWGADDEELLANAKSVKKAELTTARQNEEFYPVTTNKGTFTFDETSQNLLRNAKESLADTATRNWTTNDGVVVTMSKADFQDIFNASIARSDTNFAKLKELKQRVDNATTVEEVNAIRWEEV